MHYSGLFAVSDRQRRLKMLRVGLIAALAVVLFAGFASSERRIDNTPPSSPRHAVNTSIPIPTERVMHTSPEVRKEKLESILTRREFAGSEISAWDRFVKWLNRIIERILGWLFGGIAGQSGTSRMLAVLFAVTIVVLFLLLLAHVIARLTYGTRRNRSESQQEDIYAGPDTSRRALEEASRAASAGDFRSALRLVYLSVLLNLDDRELIRFDRTGTNWEYLATLRKQTEIQNTLRPVTVIFDRKWYGHEPATKDDYNVFVAAYYAVESAEAKA